jgi:hypothetical protein
VSVDVEVSGLATGLIEAGCISGFTLFFNHYAETDVVQNLPLHEFSGAGNLTWQASISGLLPHFGYGLVLAAKAIDGTTLGTATRHEFYFVPPGSLDTSENGDEARIVAPNFGFDVPDSPACAPHLCGAHNRYRTDKFFKLPALEGRPQAITAPTTMNCAGGLCRIANGCVAPDRSIRYYRESGSPKPLFVFSNHQGRPTSICGPAHIPMFEHPLADRAARIDQQVEGRKNVCVVFLRCAGEAGERLPLGKSEQFCAYLLFVGALAARLSDG